MTLSGGTLTNNATITGGPGGPGGPGGGSGGTGGHGVTSSGAAVTLNNQRGGKISGGVSLANYANSVTLQIGSSITGGLNVGTSTAATLTLTDDGTGGTQTYSGAVSGTTTFAGALTKAGSGTWTIDQTLGYTGGTTFAGGVLDVGSAGALGSTGTLSFSGGTLQYSAANTTDYSGRFSQAASQAYNIDTNGQNVTFATPLTSSGGSLTKTGTGTLTLTAANTYTGTTTASAGTLDLANALALQNSTLALGGGATTFDASVSANAFTLGGLSGNGNLPLTNNASTPAALALSVGNNNASTTYGGNLSGPGSLTKLGAGTLTLTGANTYTGGTILTDDPILNLGSAGALGSTGTITLNGGTLQFSAANTTDYSARFSQAANQGYYFDTNGQSVTFATGLTSSGGSLDKLGAGTLILTGGEHLHGAHLCRRGHAPGGQRGQPGGD